MAIPQLTDEQVRTWSREQKDGWWLATVFRGNMPQLTIRSAITGFLLGSILSATNLYVGAKTGWTLGVGITSVILAFVMFRLFTLLGAKDFTILENNAMQSIATSAGYMTAPLIASLAAYMMVTNKVIPWHQMILWNVVLSLLGVLVAFPLKRRYINDEQQPFPEGRACGVVLDTLYNGDRATGFFQATALSIAALIAGGVQFAIGEAYQKYLQCQVLGRSAYWYMSDKLDTWYFNLAAQYQWLPTKIAGVPFKQLGLSPLLELSMIGAGGLAGARVGNSLMIGMLLNFTIVAPWMISIGEITPRSGSMADGTAVFGRAYLVNSWCLWWGVAMMVAASLVSLLAKPMVIISAFTGLFGKREKARDVLAHIELPMWISFVGVPILVVISVWMGHEFFGVKWWHGLLSIPLICLLTLIAVNSTALTGTTPGGALSKITQFTFGALDRANPATNLMTAGMTSEVALNASNLLMDIKPGYMLGGKPRHQAIGHCIGILSGAIASTPLFFLMFLYDKNAPATGGAWAFMQGPPPGTNLQELMVSEKFSMPGAMQWKGVSDLIAGGASALKHSALIAMIVAAVAAVVIEVLKIITRNRLPISALAIGLGVVIPPDSTFMMWLGAILFAAAGSWAKTPGSFSRKLWVDSKEPICAGLIAGAALVGIGDQIVGIFLLKN